MPEIGMIQGRETFHLQQLDPYMFQIFHDGRVYMSRTGQLHCLHHFNINSYPDDI